MTFKDHPGSRPQRGVLVVDDDYDAAWALAGVLEHALGCPVRTATDGAEALDAAIDMHPDYIVMDIGMPGVNGIEAAQLVRQLLPRDPPRLVALTGMAGPRERARILAAGFLEHLVKPVDIARLLALLTGPAPGTALPALG